MKKIEKKKKKTTNNEKHMLVCKYDKINKYGLNHDNTGYKKHD